MPTSEESNLYGSSILHETGKDNLRPIFGQSSSTATPLGHNPGDTSTGIAFDFGPGGDPGHLITVGTTRSGKLVSVIAPALLTLQNSMVVLDPKLETAWLTADYRRRIGQRAVILDPWNQINELYGSQVGVTETVTSFNPLSALDPDDPDFNDDVTAIALSLTLLGPNPDHWTKSGKICIAGLVAAAVELHPGTASLRYVIDTLTADDETLMDEIEKVIAKRPNGVAARKLRRFKPRVTKDGDLVIPKEIQSIRSTAETQLELLHSETLLRSMESDNPPFNLDELATGKVTLYIGLPVNRLESHGRWLRMILTLVIRAISSAKRKPALPVVMILDELGTISPGSGLAMIEQSVGLMAGMGIRIWAILQDLPQLKRDYPESWETFISNASMIQVLNCADQTTSEYISSYLGTKTVNSKTGTWTYRQSRWENFGKEYIEERDRIANRLAKQGGPVLTTTPGNEVQTRIDAARREEWKTNPAALRFACQVAAAEEMKQYGKALDYNTKWVPDEQLAERAVLLPSEVRESPEDSTIIIMPRRGKNYRLRRFKYYSDPVLSKRVRHDPNQPGAGNKPSGSSTSPRPAPGPVPAPSLPVVPSLPSLDAKTTDPAPSIPPPSNAATKPLPELSPERQAVLARYAESRPDLADMLLWKPTAASPSIPEPSIQQEAPPAIQPENAPERPSRHQANQEHLATLGEGHIVIEDGISFFIPEWYSRQESDLVTIPLNWRSHRDCMSVIHAETFAPSESADIRARLVPAAEKVFGVSVAVAKEAWAKDQAATAGNESYLEGREPPPDTVGMRPWPRVSYETQPATSDAPAIAVPPPAVVVSRSGLDFHTLPLSPTAYAAAVELSETSRSWFNRENKVSILERKHGVTLAQAQDALTRHYVYKRENPSIF